MTHSRLWSTYSTRNRLTISFFIFRNITFEGSTSRSSGTVLVSVYGWTRNPLVEYYVQEYTSDGKGSAQGTKVGTLDSDGSTYDVWKHTQVNQPSIAGTATFTQYISNRRTARPGSGTITVKNHFDAWAKMGLNLGTHDYQVMATEGWGNAGGQFQVYPHRLICCEPEIGPASAGTRLCFPLAGSCLRHLTFAVYNHCFTF